MAVLTLNAINEGYHEMIGNLVADDYPNTIGGGSDYGAGNYYETIFLSERLPMIGQRFIGRLCLYCP